MEEKIYLRRVKETDMKLLFDWRERADCIEENLPDADGLIAGCQRILKTYASEKKKKCRQLRIRECSLRSWSGLLYALVRNRIDNLMPTEDEFSWFIFYLYFSKPSDSLLSQGY